LLLLVLMMKLYVLLLWMLLWLLLEMSALRVLASHRLIELLLHYTLALKAKWMESTAAMHSKISRIRFGSPVLVMARVGRTSSTCLNTLDQRVVCVISTKCVALRAHTALSKELLTLLLLFLVELLLAVVQVRVVVFFYHRRG
jgi:hypothetical protein